MESKDWKRHQLCQKPTPEFPIIMQTFSFFAYGHFNCISNTFIQKSPTYYRGISKQLEKILSHINLHISSYICCSPIAYFPSYCPHYHYIKSFALSYTPFTFSIYVILPTILYINALPSQSLITFPLKYHRILSLCPLVDLTLF